MTAHYPGFICHLPARSSMDNPYHRATYLVSAHQLRQLPADSGYEVAFAGRSNAGKSSAINTLTGQKSLARTSKTPGRTQQIVIFSLDEQRRIADLPGYGYAKVPAKLKEHWRQIMARYFECRQSLRGVVLVMDIRHPMRLYDTQMLEWCEAAGLPCHILLTKADKLKRGPAKSTLLGLKKGLPAGASLQLYSAREGQGREELIAVLNRWFEIEGARQGGQTR
jgi:GTP-binding protein